VITLTFYVHAKTVVNACRHTHIFTITRPLLLQAHLRPSPMKKELWN
jgi:hypothetical protein